MNLKVLAVLIFIVSVLEWLRYCVFAQGRCCHVLIVNYLGNVVVTVNYWANVAHVGSLRGRHSRRIHAAAALSDLP